MTLFTTIFVTYIKCIQCQHMNKALILVGLGMILRLKV